MRNPAVDAYIAKAAPFARPILTKIRSLFHKTRPGLAEKLKWGCPSFERGGIVGIMAAFKAHVRLVFWRRAAHKLTSSSQVTRALFDARSAQAPAARRKPPLRTPASLAAALRKDAKARAAFDALRPSHKREYAEWIAEAKTAETRERRLADALRWLREGKSRYWKYR